MITTAAPAWLRRSDQAVTWARTMLQRDRAIEPGSAVHRGASRDPRAPVNARAHQALLKIQGR